MKLFRFGRHVAAMALCASPCGAQAQMVGYGGDATYEDGILVTAGDVTTCPYKMIGTVSIGMNLDYGGGHNTQKIYANLREKAKAMAADAVVLVEIGRGHMTLFAFTHKIVTGRAIRYVDRTCAPKE